jgi:hypothetical protein
MEYVPIILAVLAFLAAGFTFYKASGLDYRIQTLEKKNRELEAGLKSLENHIKRNGKNQQPENQRNQRGGQTTQPPGREPRPQQEPRQKQPQQGQRNQQEQRARQEGQPAQAQRQPREPKEPREPRQPQEPRSLQESRQPQEPRQKQPRQPQLDADGQPIPRPQQNQRRNEGQRRQSANPAEQNQNPSVPPVNNPLLTKDLVGDDLLNRLTQQQPEAPVSRTRYAIIPEDGIIKTHQLQQRPDSDSYLEIDNPADGSTSTRYRFNLSGNQAFVISQGMDRLEDAFVFKKPEDRTVSRIVQQGDGLLVRSSSGWKIQDKARIDFR